MTFELVRIGWPNTAAILALAITPLAAFSAAPDRSHQDPVSQRTEMLAFCPSATEHVALLVTTPGSIVE